MDSIHELLPWYVNGTLEAAETASFKEHLAGCHACRDELAVLEQMQAELKRHGEALLADHPTPQTLVAALTTESGGGEPGPDLSREIKRHIALCATCADEARWVMKEAVAQGGGREPASARSGSKGRPDGSVQWSRAWLLPLAAALLLVAVAIPMIQRLRAVAETTGMIRMQFIESTQRAGEGQTVIAVPPGEGMVHLVLPVDVAPEVFPLRLEIRDAGGALIHDEDLESPGDLYRDAFLFLGCLRQDCPDGDYLVHLQSKGQGGERLEFPFRLTTAPAQP
ncbi:MAG: zf-HC2 domain-containing protein [Acidobacteria bacterium]|nr:zf-HC2 domain-containing protein [Acidobacteriota bacterium]